MISGEYNLQTDLERNSLLGLSQDRCLQGRRRLRTSAWEARNVKNLACVAKSSSDIKHRNHFRSQW